MGAHSGHPNPDEQRERVHQERWRAESDRFQWQMFGGLWLAGMLVILLVLWVR